MSEQDRALASSETRITKGMADREQVEHTADRIRGELLLTLGELERRRALAMNVPYQLMRHRELLLVGGGVVLMLVGAGVGVAIWRVRHREELLAKKRREALRRAWRHPERLAASAKSRPLSVELGRKLVLIFAGALASSIAKSSARTLVPEDAPNEEQLQAQRERQQAVTH